MIFSKHTTRPNEINRAGNYLLYQSFTKMGWVCLAFEISMRNPGCYFDL